MSIIEKIALLLLMTIVFGCGKTKPGWKTIAIANYLIDVPDNFNIKYERGIDTQPGFLKGRDLNLFFDYGNLVDTLVQTKEQYLTYWRKSHIMDVGERFMKPGVIYDHKNTTKVAILNIREATKNDRSKLGNCDFVATCRHGKITFDYPIQLPEEVKDEVVNIDTFQHHFRKIVYPKAGAKGFTGIYFRDERNSFDKPYAGLMIGAPDLTAKQEQLALKILATVRVKNGEQLTRSVL